MHTELKVAPIQSLENLRIVVESVLLKDRIDLKNAKILFQLVLGLYVESKELIEDTKVHQFNARTRMVTEITLAAKYDLTPDLIPDKKEGGNVKKNMVGRYAIDGECRETGWGTKENVQEIINVANTAINKGHEAVNKVYKVIYDGAPEKNLDDFELEDFNEDIRTKRKDIEPKLIRFEIASTEDLKKNHPLHNDEVCKALHDLLPDLPVVRYGLGNITNEGKLNAQVNAFFQMLQKYE